MDSAWVKASDIDILDAHLRSKAEYFVTRDRHLLHPRDELRRMFGIVVLTPAETLAELDRQD
jgi:predicted nucleic acid-binding protein